MNIETIARHSPEELLRGYCREGDRFCCLWCDDAFETEAEAGDHLDRAHPPEQRFETLLGAASVLGFSTAEYRIYREMFSGADAGEISRALDMPESTVRWARQQLQRQYVQAKAFLLFHSLATRRQPPLRKYKKAPLRRIPSIDGAGRVTGLHDIATLHSPHSPLRHGTVIILVCREREGEVQLLLQNKVIAAPRGRSNQGLTSAWDCFGGHVKAVPDIAPREAEALGQLLTPGVYRRTALRELGEELKIKGRAPDPARLHFLYEANYEGETLPYGANLERSHVFLYRLIEGEENIRVFDQLTDTLGEKVRREYKWRFSPLEQVMSDYREQRVFFMDGLARVLERDPDLDKTVKGYLCRT